MCSNRNASDMICIIGVWISTLWWIHCNTSAQNRNGSTYSCTTRRDYVILIFIQLVWDAIQVLTRRIACKLSTDSNLFGWGRGIRSSSNGWMRSWCNWWMRRFISCCWWRWRCTSRGRRVTCWWWGLSFTWWRRRSRCTVWIWAQRYTDTFTILKFHSNWADICVCWCRQSWCIYDCTPITGIIRWYAKSIRVWNAINS